jgi:hypothetical protein
MKATSIKRVSNNSYFIKVELVENPELFITTEKEVPSPTTTTGTETEVLKNMADQFQEKMDGFGDDGEQCMNEIVTFGEFLKTQNCEY